MKFNPIGALLLLAQPFWGCCPSLGSIGGEQHDPQVLQIYMHTGYRDDVDTFRGFLQKDLVPGTVTIPFWFTTREQEILLNALERYRFLSFPDTIYAQPGVSRSPDFGAQIIRVKFADKEKSVVWFEPPEKSFKLFPLLINIKNLIYDIFTSRPEYKALPEAKGGYL
jgi:hypothetical protein